MALYKGPEAKVNVREELWYPRYCQANEYTLNNLHRKKPRVQIKMLGVQGDLTYGLRTRHEFTCLHEDLNIGVELGKITVRPNWVQVDFKDLEEELEWADKKPDRVLVLCSCPSQVCVCVRVMSVGVVCICFPLPVASGFVSFFLFLAPHPPARSVKIQPSWTR